VIDAKTYLFIVTYIAIFANIVISLYGIFVRPNIIKKIIALSIFGDCTFIYAILIGFRKIEPYPTIPIMTTQQPSQEYIKEFVSTAVDPLPPALVLTGVVIGLAVMLFLVFLALQAYRVFGTLDIRKIVRMRG
jgi:Multisubunit Na+/H+ antiporter, MnhC subunit